MADTALSERWVLPHSVMEYGDSNMATVGASHRGYRYSTGYC